MLVSSRLASNGRSELFHNIACCRSLANMVPTSNITVLTTAQNGRMIHCHQISMKGGLSRNPRRF